MHAGNRYAAHWHPEPCKLSRGHRYAVAPFRCGIADAIAERLRNFGIGTQRNRQYDPQHSMTPPICASRDWRTLSLWAPPSLQRKHEGRALWARPSILIEFSW